jgi:Acyltransferase family
VADLLDFAGREILARFQRNRHAGRRLPCRLRACGIFQVGVARALSAKFERFLPKLAWPLLILATITKFFFVQYMNPLYYYYYYFGITLCGIIPGCLWMLVLLRSSGTILHRLLERPEPVYLGRIFYGMYLWHFPVLMIMKDQFGAPNLVRFLIGFPVIVLLATLSYAYIERHFMRALPPLAGHRIAAKVDELMALCTNRHPLAVLNFTKAAPKGPLVRDDGYEPVFQIVDNLAIQHEPHFNQIGAHPQNVKSHGREMCGHQPARL